MLEVSNLSVSYGAHRALENVSVRVRAGEICVILGANGAGKSSLLKSIAGMVRAANGTAVTIDGRNITGVKPHRIVEAGLALVPEGRGIFGDLTVAENLQLGAYGKQARAFEATRLGEVLSLFPRLAERRGQIARTMSGGEQQMVAIGRALMSHPTILMLDEPSLGLSPLLTKDLFRSLRAVRDTGVGVLLVEQNAKQSLAIADRGYLIENGHITGEGTGEELARDPAVQAAYLGGAVSGDARPGSVHPVPAQFSAATLAARAAQIQRDHVNAARNGTPCINGHVNGLGHAVADKLAASGEPIIMSSLAHELSLRAPDFVKKASRIQREHVEAKRVDFHLDAAARLVADEPAGHEAARPAAAVSPSAHELAKKAGELVARASKIQRDHVHALRAAQSAASHEAEETGVSGHGPKGRGKKLAKKAEKLARKAEKLARKAMRIND